MLTQRKQRFFIYFPHQKNDFFYFVSFFFYGCRHNFSTINNECTQVDVWELGSKGTEACVTRQDSRSLHHYKTRPSWMVNNGRNTCPWFPFQNENVNYRSSSSRGLDTTHSKNPKKFISFLWDFVFLVFLFIDFERTVCKNALSLL